jgi:hypothetical protein
MIYLFLRKELWDIKKLKPEGSMAVGKRGTDRAEKQMGVNTEKEGV